MRGRKTLPERWLFTDERQGAALWHALDRLPRGSGVVFRHYGAANRAALLRKVRAAARRRGLLLVAAEAETLTMRIPQHANRYRRRPGALTASAHGVPDLIRAKRNGAALAFLSPVFPTASHPGARTLGAVRFGLMLRQARLGQGERRMRVGALGGMSERAFARMKAVGATAWGAIDALSKMETTGRRPKSAAKPARR
ncbi:thiamine phosphate synthase [Pacificimonas flava]|uniref:Thiamine monophosphate synthase n=1 Tax=Pacificimonas flava TaxID=1234595 RepID=M2U7L6_9SPHN|nr:thiamine phosphate synthase [Pacificimonas flava]EMD83997.1 thiamine monophosphate synthase [Pacificimonas flava]MBB5281030.1 thiamine-phosphate pyrophosphorylase [Pacificimonas flava]